MVILADFEVFQNKIFFTIYLKLKILNIFLKPKQII